MESMTKPQARIYLQNIFARATKPDLRYRTDPENSRYQDHLATVGAGIFKRRALGICGYETTKTLDGIAELLLKTNIANEIVEARNLVGSIVNASMINKRAIYLSPERYLVFQTVTNSEGDTRYRIAIHAS
jgi:hypothetical protein